MADSTELVRLMKQAALDAVSAAKPVEVCFGKVTSASPLKILVEQKMTLGAAQLVLSRHVTEYATKISGGNIQDFYYVGEEPDITTLPVAPPHVHAVGKIQITIHNGLVVGDEVILIRQQGGQKYIVWDRIG